MSEGQRLDSRRLKVTKYGIYMVYGIQVKYLGTIGKSLSSKSTNLTFSQAYEKAFPKRAVITCTFVSAK